MTLGEGYVPTYTRTAFTDALHDAFNFRTVSDYHFKFDEKKLKIQKSKKLRTFYFN
jgi:hypothetical protein